MRKRRGYFRPGNRRTRWRHSHNASGSILLVIGGMFILAGITATEGAWICYALGAINFVVAFLDFRSAQVGWPISDKRPPWADKHDAIDRKFGIETDDEWASRTGYDKWKVERESDR